MYGSVKFLKGIKWFFSVAAPGLCLCKKLQFAMANNMIAVSIAFI